MLITVIVILVVSMTLLGMMMQSIVREHAQCRLRHDQRQCRRLAEAGIARARAQLAVDESFAGDEWRITANDLQRQFGAQVDTRVEISDSGAATLIATAAYPAGKSPRVRRTQRLELAP